MLIPPARTLAPSPCSGNEAERLGELGGCEELELRRQHQFAPGFCFAVWIALHTRSGVKRQLVQMEVELGERVLDRADQRPDRAADARLADALRAERRKGGGGLLVTDLEVRHLDGRRDRVVHERRRSAAGTGRRSRSARTSPPPNPWVMPAVHLGVGEEWVDDLAGVVDDRVAEDLHIPSLRIHLDDACRRGVGPRWIRAEPALPLGLVVDVRHLEVPGRLEPRVDTVHHVLVREPVGLGGDVVDRHEPFRAPWTKIFPSAASRSSGETSSIRLAIVSIFSRMSVAARWPAEPPMITLREL